MIFDDVEIPRDRLFIDCNLAAYNSVMATSWPPNIQQQTMIRASVKLDFAWGLALRVAAAINATDPETMRMIGEIWSYAEFTRSAVIAAEAEAREWPGGMWTPATGPLHALRGTLPLWFPRVNEILRLIGSHNVFATPTAAQMADKDLRPLIDKYLPGAKGMPAEERIRIFRLAWDSPAARSPAATSSTNASTSRPRRATSRVISLHRPQPRRPPGRPVPEGTVLTGARRRAIIMVLQERGIGCASLQPSWDFLRI